MRRDWMTASSQAPFIRYFGGDTVILINRDATPYDSQADMIFREPVGALLDQIIVK